MKIKEIIESLILIIITIILGIFYWRWIFELNGLTK